MLRAELDHSLRQREQGQYRSSIGIAANFAILGDNLNALKWLEKGYEDHSSSMQYLAVTPEFDQLRSNSQFQYWIGILGLPAGVESTAKISSR